jgi:pyrroline-5-carboxylate reductase
LERVGIIGAGKIGGTLVARLSSAGDFDLTVGDADEERLDHLAQTYDLETARSNAEVVRRSDLIVIAVKPWDVAAVLDEISGFIKGARRAVVSVAAGITISNLENRLPRGTAILRVMPNVCASVGMGTAVVAMNGPGEAYLPVVMDIFRRVGDVIELPEKLFDAATALHGSGPAYVALFADALTRAGVREGIPHEVARRLVNGTVAGTAILLKEAPAYEVRDEVTTPGGTTAAAIAAMEQAGFVAAVYEGVEAAAERARRMAG